VAFSRFNRNWSYVDSWGFATTDAIDAVLGTMKVGPTFCDVAAGLALTTSVGFAAQPFTYWHGTMEYRLVIISSAFHRGRLRVTYTPGEDAAGGDYNQTYSHVIDISENCEVIFPIRWATEKPYIEIPAFTAYSAAPFVNCNGKWTLSVVNGLSAPYTAKDISVQIWVRGGDDIQFQMPAKMDITTFIPNAQSKDEEAPNDACWVDFMGHVPPATDLSSVHFGEEVPSWRTLMKRSYFYMYGMPAIAPDTGVEGRVGWYSLPHYPIARGTNPYGTDRTSVAGAYSYVGWTPVGILQHAFLGQRGSTVWRIIDNFHDGSEGSFMASRTTSATPTIDDTATVVDKFLYADTRSELHDNTLSGPLGTNIGALSTLGTSYMTGQAGCSLDVVSPGYNPLRFNSGDGSYGIFDDERWEVTLVSRFTSPGNIANTGNLTPNKYKPMSVFTSAGDDMNFFFFLGAPEMAIVIDPAPAT
jgi:hypothetical protein